MILKKHILSVTCCVLFLFHQTVQAQVFDTVPMRHVLGTTGGSSAPGVLPWGTIDYTVGEVVVTSDSVSSPPFSTFKWLTQGFQQPDKNALVVDAVGVNSTCIGADNGSANLGVKDSTGHVSYRWGSDTTFRNTHLFTDLKPGIYDYVIKDGNFTISGTVEIKEDQVDCGTQLIVYKGITPNGDGQNDNWQIDGITNFETNTVSIFNRWGSLVWDAKNYDNKDVVWDGKNKQGVLIPDATYFYIIEADGKVYKGWVELTH